MNELLFISHIVIISVLTITALKIGREALIAIISIYCILANLFVLKQIKLFGLYPTASDAFAVGAILGINLLQEYYGKAIAKKAVWVCFFSLIAYTILSQIHILYVPSTYDFSHQHYTALLKFMPRIAIASIFVTLVVQHINRILYSILQKQFENRFFLLRNYTALAISSLVDTILFSLLGLYGIVSNIWQIILFSYIIKLSVIILSTPLMSLARLLRIKKIGS